MSIVTIYYYSIDGYKEQKEFDTVYAARRYAKKWVGQTPLITSFYAISTDGLDKITLSGACILDLFISTGA